MWALNRLEQKKTSRLDFSPRASEKCRVRAIADWELELLLEATDRGMRTEGFAVVKWLTDLQKDFRVAVVEMIMENGINHPEELKQVQRKLIIIKRTF